jgi:hypothetical protein
MLIFSISTTNDIINYCYLKFRILQPSRIVRNAFSLNRRPFQYVPFLGGENISLIGVDIHKKYCLGIIEGNNSETKLRFPDTRNGWHS